MSEGIKQVSLDTIADGVALELFQHELSNVMKNIVDANTLATGKRKITLSFDFAPDEMREECKVLVSIESKLQPIKSYSKTAFVGNKNGAPALFQQDTKQIEMFDENVSSFTKKGAV